MLISAEKKEKQKEKFKGKKLALFSFFRSLPLTSEIEIGYYKDLYMTTIFVDEKNDDNFFSTFSMLKAPYVTMGRSGRCGFKMKIMEVDIMLDPEHCKYQFDQEKGNLESFEYPHTFENSLAHFTLNTRSDFQIIAKFEPFGIKDFLFFSSCYSTYVMSFSKENIFHRIIFHYSRGLKFDNRTLRRGIKIFSIDFDDPRYKDKRTKRKDKSQREIEANLEDFVE